MVTKKISSEEISGLFKVILSLETEDDCRLLFDDLCTNKEVEQMAQRLKAARLLIEGKTYQQVIKETELSSATLSRVSRCVQYGGGYAKFLGAEKEEENTEQEEASAEE